MGLDNNKGKDDDKQDDEEDDTSCDTKSPNDQQHNGIKPHLQEEPVVENPIIEKFHAADESSGQPKAKQPHNNDNEPIILPAVTGSVTSCTNATPLAEFPNSNNTKFPNMLHEGAKTLTDIASIKPADKAIKDGIITGPELEAPTDREEVTEIEKADPKMLASIPLDELYLVTPILNTEPEPNNNSMWAISQYTSNYSLAATSPLYNTHNSNNITTELSEEAPDIK